MMTADASSVARHWLWLALAVLVLACVLSPGFAAAQQHGTPRFLGGPSSGDPRTLALEAALAQRSAAERGVAPDPDDYRVESERTSRVSGSTHLVLRQRVAGREVIDGDLAVHVSRDGELMALHDRFVSRAERFRAPRVARFSARQAVAAAAVHAGLPEGASATLLPSSNTREDRHDYSAPALSREAIPVRLKYRRGRDAKLALVWELRMRTPDGRHYLYSLVDATTGLVLEQSDWMRRDS
jgi:Zn-dependent metalloprotease